MKYEASPKRADFTSHKEWKTAYAKWYSDSVKCHAKPFTVSLEESGLMDAFKEICTPDTDNLRALQWLQRRPQLAHIKHWPQPHTLGNYRRRWGVPASDVYKGKGGRGERLVDNSRKKPRQEKVADIAPGSCIRKRRYAPTDEQFHC